MSFSNFDNSPLHEVIFVEKCVYTCAQYSAMSSDWSCVAAAALARDLAHLVDAVCRVNSLSVVFLYSVHTN